jgi:MarR-like DNA-binding transcriptional regulator SgrR of sgrS sRNA
MMRCRSISLAASSLAWLALLSSAEQRPHYGGSLRIAVRETPQALDPASLAASGSANISRLMFETLVRLDESGRPQPLLASSWQSEPGNQRWRISLRDGVSFSDGFPLDASSVVASLRGSNPDWKVMAVEEMVMIETPKPEPDLPAELALPRNAIVHHAGGKLLGTGPFSAGDWAAGKRVSLQANDQHWRGRPFLDAIEIAFAVPDREQLLALDLGKADIVEIASENIRRAKADGRTVLSSEPAELLALVFANDARSEDEAHARNALASILDRNALGDFVMQGGGEPTAALLPNWLSGYAFVFPAAGQSDRASQERTQSRHLSSWTLAYDLSDPVAHVIADRVLLNARDAGISIQLVSSGAADIRLARIPLESSDPHLALSQVATALQLPPPKFNSDSVADLYTAEKGLLQSRRLIPLLHLRGAIAARANVRDFGMLPDGTWQLSNVWLAPEKQ